jgi:regulatory protein
LRSCTSRATSTTPASRSASPKIAWGAERIERKLREAGVPAEHIEAALGTQTADEAREAAIDLLRRRLSEPPRDDRGRERALGLLVRRGYDLELAYDAVRAFERAA